MPSSLRLNSSFPSLLVALAGALLSRSATADVHYALSMEPKQRLFHVEIETKATQPTTTFRIPAWCPGYYVTQNYQSNITDVQVTGPNGTVLKPAQPDTRSWAVSTPVGSPIKFSYSVRADDAGLGFFASMLSDRVGFINGASAFLYIDGRKTESDSLVVKTPAQWEMATGLDKSGDHFLAKSGYDELIDNPLQFGSFVRKPFTVEGIPFEVVFVSKDGKIRCDPDFEVNRLRIMSAEAIKMFRGAGFKHYTYILHLAVGNFDGGLEHRASTCIAIANTAKLEIDDLAAHENFHAWNVKQIRPFVLGPFDYTQPDRTANLWWMEGVTDYYSKILTYRSGLQDQDWLLNEIRSQVGELQNGRTRDKVTLADCSRNCWENDGFGVGDMSYYTKGFLVGFILDASIRSQTNGAKSLDDVMRLLYSKYHLPNPGVPEDGILAALNEVVGQAAFDRIYHSMIETTDELPYDVLRTIGIEVQLPGKPSISAGYVLSDGRVTQVDRFAASGGLQVGDKVIGYTDNAWNGVTPAVENTASLTYTVDVERDGQVVHLTLTHSLEPTPKLDLLLDETADQKALKLRAGWLQRPDRRVKEGNGAAVGDKKGAGK